MWIPPPWWLLDQCDSLEESRGLGLISWEHMRDRPEYYLTGEDDVEQAPFSMEAVVDAQEKYNRLRSGVRYPDFATGSVLEL